MISLLGWHGVDCALKILPEKERRGKVFRRSSPHTWPPYQFFLYISFLHCYQLLSCHRSTWVGFQHSCGQWPVVFAWSPDWVCPAAQWSCSTGRCGQCLGRAPRLWSSHPWCSPPTRCPRSPCNPSPGSLPVPWGNMFHQSIHILAIYVVFLWITESNHPQNQFPPCWIKNLLAPTGALYVLKGATKGHQRNAYNLHSLWITTTFWLSYFFAHYIWYFCHWVYLFIWFFLAMLRIFTIFPIFTSFNVF